MNASLFPLREPSGIFSECEDHGDLCPDAYCTGRKYRYLLRIPTGLDNDRICLWVLANPSTATPDKLDPTIRRCLNWSRQWGYGWCHTVNVRAWRATHPETVPPDPMCIGFQNGHYIAQQVVKAGLIVCGWGQLGGVEGLKVLQLIRDEGGVPHALKIAKNGAPYHPLYLPNDSKPFVMEASQ